MDPEQTAPIGAVCSGSTLFAIEASLSFSRPESQTTFDAIGALRVNLPVFLSSKDLLVLVYLSKGTGDTRLLSVLSLSGLIAGSLSVLRDFVRGSGVGFWFLTVPSLLTPSLEKQGAISSPGKGK